MSARLRPTAGRIAVAAAALLALLTYLVVTAGGPRPGRGGSADRQPRGEGARAPATAGPGSAAPVAPEPSSSTTRLAGRARSVELRDAAVPTARHATFQGDLTVGVYADRATDARGRTLGAGSFAGRDRVVLASAGRLRLDVATLQVRADTVEVPARSTPFDGNVSATASGRLRLSAPA